MYVMIDHQDSFVYNLVSYFEELGCDMQVLSSNGESERFVESLYRAGVLEGLIFSPGPKTPQDYLSSARMLARMAGRIPILGICLGHQLIGHGFGAEVVKGNYPMHGKLTSISHSRLSLFAGLPEKFEVTRYHSLVVSPQNLPPCFSIDAYADDGSIMALRHQVHPIFGLQYHPEAVLTEYGYEVLANFKAICERWQADGSYDKAVAAV